MSACIHAGNLGSSLSWVAQSHFPVLTSYHSFTQHSPPGLSPATAILSTYFEVQDLCQLMGYERGGQDCLITLSWGNHDTAVLYLLMASIQSRFQASYMQPVTDTWYLRNGRIWKAEYLTWPWHVSTPFLISSVIIRLLQTTKIQMVVPDMGVY